MDITEAKNTMIVCTNVEPRFSQPEPACIGVHPPARSRTPLFRLNSARITTGLTNSRTNCGLVGSDMGSRGTVCK